jgi:hypothetical protein
VSILTATAGAFELISPKMDNRRLPGSSAMSCSSAERRHYALLVVLAVLAVAVVDAAAFIEERGESLIKPPQMANLLNGPILIDGLLSPTSRLSSFEFFYSKDNVMYI